MSAQIRKVSVLVTLLVSALTCSHQGHAAANSPVTITSDSCVAARVGKVIDAKQIGEPVGGVTLDPPMWNEARDANPAFCLVTGSIAPVDTSPAASAIRFAVALPGTWNRIGMQLGGGGMDGTVPQLAGAPGGGDQSVLAAGIATYGSDSGHTVADPTWATNDEAIRNFSYLQLKKTHDVAMQVIRRLYDAAPRYNYFVGTSQGGREAMTAAQRYWRDYDGIVANVPVVAFSSLVMAPTWIQIAEKTLSKMVPTVKSRAIVAEFMRQCDALDGLVDGVISDYVDCRAIFNINDNAGTATPWAAKRCPESIDPNPTDASPDACLTDGQIETLNFVFSRYRFKVPLANRVQAFGMWAPTTDLAGGGGGARAGRGAPVSSPSAGTPTVGPQGAGAGPGPDGRRGNGGPDGGARGGGGPTGGLFSDVRYRGQEGAAADAPVYGSLGVIGLTGFVLGNLSANPLDYVEGSTALERRRQVSEWIDSTNPDLSAFRRRGGKLIVAIGTNDTVASSGAQLDYYQSLVDKMGRTTLDAFARLYVLPQVGHGLNGNSYSIDGEGKSVPPIDIPSNFDRVALIRNWVEHGVAPGAGVIATGAVGSRPACNYPQYPRYHRGETSAAASYACTSPGH